jgi:hypothetical protein
MILFGYLAVVLTGILVILLSKILDIIWARMVSIRGIYLIIRAPGIVVHECSHILGCLLTGAKVKNVVFLSKEGGSVTYSPSPIPFLGEVLINTAPLFCIPLALFGCTWIFSSYFGCVIPAFPSSINSVDTVSLTGTQITTMFTTNLIHHFNAWFLVYLYLTISLVLSLAPSRQDMKNAALGTTMIIAFGMFIIWSNFAPAIYLLDTLTNVVGVSFAIGLVFGMIALVVSLPLVILYIGQHR